MELINTNNIFNILSKILPGLDNVNSKVRSFWIFLYGALVTTWIVIIALALAYNYFGETTIPAYALNEKTEALTYDTNKSRIEEIKKETFTKMKKFELPFIIQDYQYSTFISGQKINITKENAIENSLPNLETINLTSEIVNIDIVNYQYKEKMKTLNKQVTAKHIDTIKPERKSNQIKKTNLVTVGLLPSDKYLEKTQMQSKIYNLPVTPKQASINLDLLKDKFIFQNINVYQGKIYSDLIYEKQQLVRKYKRYLSSFTNKLKSLKLIGKATNEIGINNNRDLLSMKNQLPNSSRVYTMKDIKKGLVSGLDRENTKSEIKLPNNKYSNVILKPKAKFIKETKVEYNKLAGTSLTPEKERFQEKAKRYVNENVIIPKYSQPIIGREKLLLDDWRTVAIKERRLSFNIVSTDKIIYSEKKQKKILNRSPEIVLRKLFADKKESAMDKTKYKVENINIDKPKEYIVTEKTEKTQPYTEDIKEKSIDSKATADLNKIDLSFTSKYKSVKFMTYDIIEFDYKIEKLYEQPQVSQPITSDFKLFR